MADKPQLSLARIPPAARGGLGALVAVLVGAGYYVILHTEIATRIDSEHSAEKTLAKELDQQKSAQATYLADKDELTRRQQNERTLNKVLPPDAQTASFLSAVQQVSNVAGVTLNSFKPNPETNGEFYASVPMQIEAKGKFHQIGKFMYEMGKQERIINLENIELTDPKLTGEDEMVKMKCLATTYHLLKKAPAPATSTPGAPAPAPAPKPGEK